MMRIEVIKKKNGCHECTSHKRDQYGYPRKCHRGKNTPIHRVVYEEMNGPIPKGLVVRHSCDNPSCLNPEHLSIGTIQDNVRDRETRGRTSRAPRTLGEVNGMSKLTDAEVLEIRSLKGKATQSEIAKMFNVNQTRISAIHRGVSWHHLGGIS